MWFWSNHFCVSLDASVMAGGYEREAIRPHVLGRFVDMLIAAESHPAMLIYLNNAQSIGPDSVAGSTEARASTKTSRASFWNCTHLACAPVTPRRM